MNQNNDRITITQMVFILMLTMVGAGVLSLPRNIAVATAHDHWLVVILGGLAALLASFIHISIIKIKPNMSYFDILSDALTKPMGYVVGVVYIIYFIGFIGLITVIFGNVIKSFLLTFTPIEIIFITILLTSVYICRKGIEVLGRMMELIIPSSTIVIIIIFALSFTGSKLENLLPVFNISFSEIVNGVSITFFSFIGFEILLFFGEYLNEPRKAARVSISIIFITLFYLLVVVSTIAKFGSIQLKHLVWPTLDLFDTIEFPGLFIENVQVAVMALWVIIVFATIAPMFLSANIMLRSIIGSKDHAYLAAPIFSMIYLAAQIPRSISHTYEILDIYTKYFSTLTIFIIPLIVLTSLLIQRKLKRGEEANV